MLVVVYMLQCRAEKLAEAPLRYALWPLKEKLATTSPALAKLREQVGPGEANK